VSKGGKEGRKQEGEQEGECEREQKVEQGREQVGEYRERNSLSYTYARPFQNTVFIVIGHHRNHLRRLKHSSGLELVKKYLQTSAYMYLCRYVYNKWYSRISQI